MREEKNKEKKKKILFVIFVILLCSLLLFGGFRFGVNMYSFINQSEKSGVTIINPGFIIEKAAKIIGIRKQDEGNVIITGKDYFQAKADSVNAKVILQNPNENKDKYYLRFVISLVDTGEVLYESDYVEPGKEITEIELSRTFDKGIYQTAVLVIPSYMNDISVLCNTAVYSLTLHVL